MVKEKAAHAKLGNDSFRVLLSRQAIYEQLFKLIDQAEVPPVGQQRDALRPPKNKVGPVCSPDSRPGSGLSSPAALVPSTRLRPKSARAPRSASTRVFLSSALSREGASDAVVSVPAWKEALVERARRRASTKIPSVTGLAPWRDRRKDGSARPSSATLSSEVADTFRAVSDSFRRVKALQSVSGVAVRQDVKGDSHEGHSRLLLNSSSNFPTRSTRGGPHENLSHRAKEFREKYALVHFYRD